MAETKSNINGFTLVEVIVVAVLTSVLALGVFTVFNMYANTSRQTAAYLKLQRQGEALVEEIAMKVRNGAWVLAHGENPADFAGGLWGDENVFTNSFTIHYNDGSTYTFSLDGENIMLNGNKFPTAADPVLVDAAKTPQPFALLPDRKQAEIDVRLKTVANNGEEFFLNIQRGAFICRN